MRIILDNDGALDPLLNGPQQSSRSGTGPPARAGGAVTERLTDSLGTAIAPVSPMAGNVVCETEKTTSDLVSGLGLERR